MREYQIERYLSLSILVRALFLYGINPDPIPVPLSLLDVDECCLALSRREMITFEKKELIFPFFFSGMIRRASRPAPDNAETG